MVALTPSTQFSVEVLVAEGKNTSAIARELCLARKTVNGYRDRGLKSFNCSSEVELMHLAIRPGLVRVPGTI